MAQCSTREFELIVRAYYGELSDREQAEFQQLLQTNSQFAQQYYQLTRTLDLYAAHTVALPDNERFWGALEHGICHRIRQEARSSRNNWWHTTLEFLRLPRRLALAAAGSLGLLLLGVVLGASLRPAQNTYGQMPALSWSLELPWTTSAASTAAGVATNEHLRSFFKRSQLYIATTADKHLECNRCIPIERQLDHRQFARELLSEAQRLRPLAHHNPKVKKVLQDVELILATMTNDSQSLTPAQMEVLHNIASSTVCEVAATVDSNSENVNPSSP